MRAVRFSFAALVLITLTSNCAYGQSERASSSDEYKVYEAVLGLMDRFPVADPRVTIYGMTLTTKCGEDGSGAPLLNGCTFFWVKPDNAGTVKKLLQEEWGGFERSTWADFETKNAASVRLDEPIATPWKHKLVFPGDPPAKDSSSEDLAIFLSRVGFDEKKTEAVVYVLMFSYMKQVNTAGDYFLFRRNEKGQWEPNGRVTYFHMGDGGSSE